MQRIFFTLIISFMLVLSSMNPALAWFFGGDTLVTIEGQQYSAEDYKRWWSFMKEEDSPVPDTPDSYVDWLLLTAEAERIGLSSDPGFKRATDVFLTARTLLMLKYDQVDSQIDITDEKIKEAYKATFLPLWQLERFKFKDEQSALAAWAELDKGTLTVEQLIEIGPAEYNLESNQTSWVRPTSIDEGWTAIFKKMDVGGFVEPSEHKYGPTLYFIREKRMGSDEDLANLKDLIYKELWRAQEDLLTHNLIFKLRDQYEVEVNQERLEALDILAPVDSFSDEPIITSTRQNISEKEFMIVINRLRQTRPQMAHVKDEEEVREFKNETAFNIIAQSVTNWGALDQHYEEKEPFKWSYEFSYNYRLGQMLEQREFLSKTDVTEEELLENYNQNLDNYSVPATVKLYMIDETQGPINQIWAETSTGKKFLDVVRAIPDLRLELQQVPVNHLDPTVKPVVQGLSKGETSQIFTAQDVKVLVHLVEVVPQKPLSFDRVKESIRNKLKHQKASALRKDYLDVLKAQSEISINERQWEKIKSELGGQ